MPYPSYLSGSDVHVAILTYPVEGASVQISVDIGEATVLQQVVVIPSGTSPAIFNISCAICYSSTGEMALSAIYPDDPSPTTMPLDQDSLAGTSITVVDGGTASVPADVTVSFGGITEPGNFLLQLWCALPAMVTTANARTQSSDLTVNFAGLPGLCDSDRYVVITSSNGVHVAVIESAGPPPG